MPKTTNLNLELTINDETYFKDWRETINGQGDGLNIDKSNMQLIDEFAGNVYSKDDIDDMIDDIPTLRPTIELEVASLTTLTEAEKLAIKNSLNTLIVGDKIDGTKFDDIILVTTTDLIRLHYSSIDYYVANPQITVIFETHSTKYMLQVPLVDYTYSTLTSITAYTKTEIDTMIGDIETLLAGI